MFVEVGGWILALLFIGVLYVVVALVLRSGFSVARSGRVRVDRRVSSVLYSVREVAERLESLGWVQQGPSSSTGDTTFAKQSLRLLVSPSAEGSTVFFAGVTCRRRESDEIEYSLDEVFNP